MNIEQIEEAIARKVPFTIKVADGDTFLVKHTDYISVPGPNVPRRSFVIVYNERGFAHVLPLVMVTSLTYPVEEQSPNRD